MNDLQGVQVDDRLRIEQQPLLRKRILDPLDPSELFDVVLHTVLPSLALGAQRALGDDTRGHVHMDHDDARFTGPHIALSVHQIPALERRTVAGVSSENSARRPEMIARRPADASTAVSSPAAASDTAR